MNIQKISTQSSVTQQPNFKAAFVTLSQKNLGQKIAADVVDTFNSTTLPKLQKAQSQEANAILAKIGIGPVIKGATDFIDKVNCFILAAGSGSRFRELAQTVGDYNKISLPFKHGNGEKVHMLDFALAMNKAFIGEEGIQKIIAQQPSGSFGDIVQYYLAGNPIKDTVVCCGDNVFGDNAKDLTKFFVETINNPNKHVALIGVERTPEEVAKRFGVLTVEGSLEDGVLGLTGFSEKPELEVAEELAIDGKNIANTGYFYLSKEVMEKLIDEINNNINNIKKSDSEPYDFALAVKYAHSKLNDWFGVESKKGADVKVVKKWEDVGEPAALYNFAEEVKNGVYLENFPKETSKSIQKSFKERIHTNEPAMPYIAFTESAQPSIQQINDAKEVEGVKIVVD